MDNSAAFKENKALTPGQKLEKRYKSSLTSLLTIAVFSGINLLLLLLNTDYYFLFSSYIPYLLGDYAMFYSGRYPEEYYSDVPDIEFFGTEIFAVLIAVAVAVILFYVLSWYFAKKKKAVWLVFSTGLFAADTLVMFFVIGFSPEMILDVIFHIWAMVSLILGVFAYMKLKKLPGETVVVTDNTEVSESSFVFTENSPILRVFDPDEKGKSFVEAEYEGIKIIFRRAKRVNELIINGNVYAEYEVLTEKEHTLSADFNNHRIEAVYDGSFMCYINVDGQTIAKKARLI